MKKLKKLFFGYDLNYKKLIIYSVICGIIPGIILMIPVFRNTSIENIGVCYEAWVFLALFIILNSDSALEAGIKTTIFFLISQPLCYLVQVPFYEYGFEIFKFYKFWFILTLSTFPGAMLAYLCKKENYLSVLILSLANILLTLEFSSHLKTFITSFPCQLLALVFIIFEIIIFAEMIFESKKKKIIVYVIAVISLVLSLLTTFEVIFKKSISSIVQLDINYTYEIVKYDKEVEVKLNGNFLNVSTSSDGEYDVFIKRNDGKEMHYVLTKKNNDIDLEEKE